MIDLVRIFETYAGTKGWNYAYGSEAHINLLESDINPDQIYLLLFPVKRSAVYNDNKTKVKWYSFSGKFFLVKDSNMGRHYFNENQTDQADSKYTLNIEPLLNEHESFGSSLSCGDLDVNEWSCMDAVDVLDANKDGIWCTFNVAG